jgi:hypothetical protein
MNRRIEQILSLPLWIILFPLAPNVLTHWDMVKGNRYVKKLKRASFSDLKKEMDKVKWEYNPSWPKSLFDTNDYYANYFHASIFRFGDVGYLMTFLGYIMASLYQKKIRKKLPSYKTSVKQFIN